MTNTITKAFVRYLRTNVFAPENGASRNANPSKAQRETWSEFGCVAAASKHLRTAFGNLSRHIADRSMIARLSKQLFNVIRTDRISPRGFRNVPDGNIALLENFQFNADANLNRVFHTRYNCSFDREKGWLIIDIPAFDPALLHMPANATHFRLLSGGAEIDFKTNDCISDTRQTDLLSLSDPCKPIRLKHIVTPGTKLPLFIALGIEPHYTGSGECRSWDRRFNSFAIIKTSRQ